MTAARATGFDTVPKESRAFHGEPAGLVTRTLANIVDLIVVSVLLALGYVAVAGLLFLRRGASFTFPIVTYRVAYLVGFGAWVIYMAFGWRTNGRTYGDQLLGLRVRTIDDDRVSGVRAVIRALLCGIAPLLLLWVAVSKEQRSVQDLIVGTHVVYDWGGSRQPKASDDAGRVGVDVAAPIADEPDDGHAQPLPRVDGER
jgi:uncharacterized RDD family membrane protein YckC